MGLELSVVRQLVTMHGGAVAAKSAGPGMGSCFTVRLPMVAVASPPMPTELESQSPSHASVGPSTRPLSIVVIDDSEDVRELMADLLRAWGHTVEVAPDGVAGSELTLRQKPDVAFVDIGLPKLDGYGVAAYVREHMPDTSTRLVAMTGFGQESDRRRALAAGFDIHIVKPASMDALRNALSFEDS
jgi:CheY-like chemotaxis protein